MRKRLIKSLVLGIAFMILVSCQTKPIQESVNPEGESAYIFAKDQKLYLFNKDTFQLDYITNIQYDWVKVGVPKIYLVDEMVYFNETKLIDGDPAKPCSKILQYNLKTKERKEIFDSNAHVSLIGNSNDFLYCIERKDSSSSSDSNFVIFRTDNDLKKEILYQEDENIKNSYVSDSGVLLLSNYDSSTKKCNLYKIDEGQKTLLCSEERFDRILLYEEKVYYSYTTYQDGLKRDRIFCIDLVTKEKNQLYQSREIPSSYDHDQTFRFLIYDNEIYFSNGDDGTYKMSLDGRNCKQFDEKNYNSMVFILDNQLFFYQQDQFDYIERSPELYTLRSYDLKTKEIKQYSF